MSEKLPVFRTEKFQTANLKLSKDQLASITEALLIIKKYNRTIQITRNSLVYSLLKAAMNNDIKILQIDGVEYTFKELMDLPNKSKRVD
jgi:hypothetical protein